MFSGNAVFAFGQFGTMIVVAKLAGPEALGTYVLANAVTAPIFAFSGLGLQHSLATDVNNHYSLSSYAQLYVLSSILALAACIGIASIGGYTSVALLAISALSIARVAENGSQLCYGLFQLHEQIQLISRSLIFRGVLGFVTLLVVLSIFKERIEWAVLGMALSWIFVFLLHDVFRSSHLPHNLGEPNSLSSLCDLSRMRALVTVVLPLGALALITSLGINIPRYFIEQQLGTRELGYFAAVVQLANMGAVVINAIGQTIVPRLAKYYLQESKAYIELLFKALFLAAALGFCGIALAWFFGGKLLTIFYSNAFAAHAHTLVAAMVWSAILYLSTTIGCAMTAIRSFRSQFVIGGASLLIMLLASWPLIDTFGMVGAVYAMIIGISAKIILQVAILSCSLHGK